MEGVIRGEVRRIHVVYFLSHGGQTEQPHFFRVHHASRKGVFLRDVKRWLADLRGQDMPDAFAWSYKRKYRTGYIWQDLVDDDLLNPISDNEYVILGSTKRPSSFYENFTYDEASPMKKKSGKGIEEEDSGVGEAVEEEESPDVESPKSSILTDDDSVKLEEEEKHFDSSSSFRFGLLRSKNKKKNNKMEVERYRTSSTIILPAATAAAAASGTFTWPSAANSQFPKRKSCSNGASHVFRNLITCGAVDTKEAILVMMNRPGADSTGSPMVKYRDCHQEAPRRSSSRGKTWNDKNETPREYLAQKSVPAACKPASRPTCSQCGKPFKPEKMHKHMRSCPGMKSAMRKNLFAPEGALEKEFNRSRVDSPLFHQPSSSSARIHS